MTLILVIVVAMIEHLFTQEVPVLSSSVCSDLKVRLRLHVKVLSSSHCRLMDEPCLRFGGFRPCWEHFRKAHRLPVELPSGNLRVHLRLLRSTLPRDPRKLSLLPCVLKVWARAVWKFFGETLCFAANDLAREDRVLPHHNCTLPASRKRLETSLAAAMQDARETIHPSGGRTHTKFGAEFRRE